MAIKNVISTRPGPGHPSGVWFVGSGSESEEVVENDFDEDWREGEFVSGARGLRWYVTDTG